MAITRKSFLKSAIFGAAAIAATSPFELFAQKNKPVCANLNIAFNESVAPFKTLEEKLDFMEKNGVVGLEPNGGGLAGRVSEFKKALNGRNVKISAICAGFQGFILAEDAVEQKKFFDTFTEILGAAGELGSVGVVLVPAFVFQKPAMIHSPETRKFLVEKLQILGDTAIKCGTTVILEPLNRTEAHYLRQVGDAASICRDVNSAGVKCMGDFWHMTFEENSDYGAFHSAKNHLAHVHIASRGRRVMPGEDGVKDNYIDGFKALKEMNYNGHVSFECGCHGENKEQIIVDALKHIRAQWKNA